MIAEAVRMEVARALRRLAFFALGTVVEVNWGQQAARVRIGTTGQETNWLRVGTDFASGGDGEVQPLAGGDDVLVCFVDGNPSGPGVVLKRLYGSNGAPEMAEQAYGVKRGAHKVLFGADGAVVSEVTSYKVTAEGTAEIDGTSVVLGAGVSAAVKFEELAAALNPWVLSVQTAFQGLGVTLPLPVLSGARAGKVRVG